MYASTALHAAIDAVRSQYGPSSATAAWALYVHCQQAPAGLYLSEPDALALCHVTTWPSVRRIFARLQTAGLLTCYYGPNNSVHVTWQLGLPPRANDHLEEPNDHPVTSVRTPHVQPTLREPTVPYQTGAQRATAPNPAQTEQPNRHATRNNSASTVQTGASRATSARDSCTVVSQFSITAPTSSGRTNKQPTSAAATVSYAAQAHADQDYDDQDYDDQDYDDQDYDDQDYDDQDYAGQAAAPYPQRYALDPQDEYERSFAFLRDPEVNLDPETAERFARSHALEYLIQQVFSFRHQLAKGQVHSYGAIITRIDRPFRPLPLTKDDRATPLFRRHAPPWMLTTEEDERRQKYIPPEYADIIIG